jgi:hypothetical protein
MKAILLPPPPPKRPSFQEFYSLLAALPLQILKAALLPVQQALEQEVSLVLVQHGSGKVNLVNQ